MPESYDGEAMLAGLTEGLDQIPSHLLRSITFDQGSECACWETVAASYNIDIWFCDPHSPWQRGQVENLNQQWQWSFPRGTDLGAVEQAVQIMPPSSSMASVAAASPLPHVKASGKADSLPHGKPSRGL